MFRCFAPNASARGRIVSAIPSSAEKTATRPPIIHFSCPGNLIDIEHPLSLGEFKPHLIDRDPQELYRSIKDKLKPSTRKILLSKTATKGKRSDVIWRLENELSEQGCTDTEIFILVKHSVWNKFAGRRDEDGQLRRELNKIRSKNSVNKLSRLSDDGLEINEPETLQYLQLSKVKAEHVKWLWYPYIPHSKVTLIEGDPGLGKSWVTLALASMVSKYLLNYRDKKNVLSVGVLLFFLPRMGLLIRFGHEPMR